MAVHVPMCSLSGLIAVSLIESLRGKPTIEGRLSPMPNTLDAVDHFRQQLINHPMYTAINTLPALHIYMQHHVFAVWDFMTLLKRLQNDLTQVSVPWIPKPHPDFVRFINEIVLGEESDEDGQGGYLSHFELYLASMEESGADTGPITTLIAHVQNGGNPLEQLWQLKVPDSVYQFVQTSLSLAQSSTTHEVCSAFFYGREDIIPDMFRTIVKELSINAKMERFLYYLKRHIEVDSEQHGPLAQQLLTQLIGGDQTKYQEAQDAAIRALKARLNLWDGVLADIKATVALH